MAKKSNPVLRKIVLDKYNGHCAYCGCELKTSFHIDHFIPRRRYRVRYGFKKDLPIGSNTVDNYMPCCLSCNSCKSDLSLEEFRERIADRVYRLNTYSSEYCIAKRFGLVIELNPEIIFYFEKFEMQCHELEQ